MTDYNSSHTGQDIDDAVNRTTNIDNTSDANKPVSTATQAELNLRLEKGVADFTSQFTEPSHREGRLYYSDDTKTLTLMNDIPGTAIDVGREQRMRVINRSGSAIVNGAVCRHDGVDLITGMPKIVLALADTLQHSRVMGVATHVIGVDEEGEVTTFGSLGKDMAGIAAGVPLYLSDTVAGQVTPTPPDLVSQVGGGLVTGSDGKMFVSIINHINLPTLIGILQDTGATVFTLTTAYQDIAPFSVSDSLGTTLDASTGHITIPNTGWYRVTINLTGTIVADTPARDNVILIRLRDNTAGEDSAATTMTIHDDSPVGSRSISGLFRADAGADLAVQVAIDAGTRDLTFNTIAYDITSVNIT